MLIEKINDVAHNLAYMGARILAHQVWFHDIPPIVASQCKLRYVDVILQVFKKLKNNACSKVHVKQIHI